MPSKAAMTRVSVALALLCPWWLSGCSSGSAKATAPPTCPSPQGLAPVTGVTFGTPTERRTSASLACLYREGGSSLEVGINTSSATASQFRAAEDAAATASHLNPTSVPNLGNAAYLLTSATTQGVTELVVLAGGHVITVAGSVSAAQAEAIAHDLVNQVAG